LNLSHGTTSEISRQGLFDISHAAEILSQLELCFLFKFVLGGDNSDKPVSGIAVSVLAYDTGFGDYALLVRSKLISAHLLQSLGGRTKHGECMIKIRFLNQNELENIRSITNYWIDIISMNIYFVKTT